ncbi:3-dehydroshikimate dehydratase [Lachnellula suecica]|uniref:3-dehydroshikimate dehydratase n=1 Tax=Lachnellula suecica TaxID=602035 RepID=A0A8T9CKW6_9HELO|nr:3-dehydroshikimate dehydratase [Lachnellula suecica]
MAIQNPTNGTYWSAMEKITYSIVSKAASMLFRPAISSMSLGRAWLHKLPNKLDQAQVHGFEGIEVFYEDLEYLAREERGITSNETPTPEAQIRAAYTIKKLCDERNLTIIGLQPFMHYEGLLDRAEHAQRIEKMKLWFKLAKILGTDIIQIPANFLPKEQITGDLEMVARDLQEVADLGLKEYPVIRFAYENLCWSTYFDTWEKAWEVVEKVDRPNFGMCLDTFNIAGRIYGDPASSTGKTPNADEDIKKSLERMVKTVDVKKVFYIQVVDAEKMRDPLIQGHAFYAVDQPARMSWSRNARLFAFEEPGYLPIMDVTRAFIEGLGYHGWVSMELFSRTMSEPGTEVPQEHARRAGASWRKIEQAIDSWKN